ncbi:fungal-specific transcription factor domain-containing protein [Hyaloscypha finlandica]|nr:fungal-specific transcription factor domain-containing protein [Hyaloscypha finlandica]
MTRPKVDPDKRQRTAQACESCKRRKQKCNGVKPCQTCAKRGLSCVYGAPEDDADGILPSPKRRMVDPASNGHTSGPAHQISPETGHTQSSPQAPKWTPVTDNHRLIVNELQDDDVKLAAPSKGLFLEGQRDVPKAGLNILGADSALVSAGSVSEKDEEAEVYNYTRMLQDPSGRLLYIGDSATLSFLQLIRMIVDNVAGPSPFTLDPRRHRIVENIITLPENIRHTHLLPDRQTANILVESYFTNINGLVEVFHRKSFMTTLDTCYSDPLSVDPNWLCLLFLVLAIGLVMAAPSPGTREDAIIQKLKGERADRAEVFYLDAKHLKDPSAGFEDAGFWSIQALTLMAVYNLAVSKRNAAYAFYGMAVRSAFALGLHREETMCIFSSAEQSIRRNLWRSLFVLDRFLAASLGRPTAIRESDCSGTTLSTGEKAPFPQAPFPTASNANFTGPHALGLEASVRSCHVIGVILEKVYSKRKISTKIAQEIADACKAWNKTLDPSLHYQQAKSASPAQGIAILHVNLLYCHSIVLLTRPFFLFVMYKIHQDPIKASQRSERSSSRMDKFAEACVISSSHSIALVQTALEGRYLPHRTPFVLYFLFAAALIVLANEFSGIYNNPSANSNITNAINIMHYFAQQDPQGSRLLFILTSFRDVVQREQATRDQQTLSEQQAQAQAQTFAQQQLIPVNDANDPMDKLFQGKGKHASEHPSAATDPISGRNNSTASLSPANVTSQPPMQRNSSSSNETLSPGDPDMMAFRHNSLDAFFDLARASSHPHSTGSVHDSDSLGDAEIDFESLWQWPSSNGLTGLTPGLGPGLGLTSTLGPGQNSVLAAVPNGIDIQGISDSSVPLFAMRNGEFGGN